MPTGINNYRSGLKSKIRLLVEKYQQGQKWIDASKIGLTQPVDNAFLLFMVREPYFNVGFIRLCAFDRLKNKFHSLSCLSGSGCYTVLWRFK